MWDDRSFLFCSQEITVITPKNQQNLSYKRDHVQIPDKECGRLLLVVLLVLLLVLLLLLLLLILLQLILILILVILLLLLLLLIFFVDLSLVSNIRLSDDKSSLYFSYEITQQSTKLKG